MRLKRKQFLNWKLYVITDPASAGERPLEEVVRLAIEGGANVVQLRDKSASNDDFIGAAARLLKVTRHYQVPLIINDRLKIAEQCGAEGVHLGQDDGTYAQARALLGPEAIIGRSTHCPGQILAAQEEGFDYIGVGPVFETPTKPGVDPCGLDLVRYASSHTHIPFVAIGGINTQNVKAVVNAGARTVAVVRAVMSAENPKKAAEDLLSFIL